MSLEFLTAQGWQAKRHTLTTFQTYLWGTLFALPFILLAGGMYRMFLFDRAVLLDHTGLILLAVIIVSVPLHEALHGFGWKLAGRLQKGDVTFFVHNGIPVPAGRSFQPKPILQVRFFHSLSWVAAALYSCFSAPAQYRY